MRVLTLLLLGLAACDEPTTDDNPPGDTGMSDWQPVTYTDEGEVCFEPDGDDVQITVTAPDCLSSSCSRNLGGSCTATVKGTEITLESEITWEQDMGQVPCTDDCGLPQVTCTIDGGLPDGTYTVTHGADPIQLTVPLTDDACDPY